MTNNIKNEFKSLINKLIAKHDFLKIAKIFGNDSDYTRSSLLLIVENQSNKKYINLAKEYFKNFLFSRDDLIDNHGINFELNSEIINFIINDDNFNEDKTKLFCFSKLAFVLSFYKRLENRLNKETTLTKIDQLENLIEFKYFRGQSNYKWHMSPSVFRNLNKNIVFDDNFYYFLLCENKLENKYNELLGSSNYKRYKKYAFMQHSCSYSPFIDFTKDSIIAASFALSNPSSINDFNNNSSSLICLKFDDEDENIITDLYKAREFIINHLKLNVINSDKFILGKDYSLFYSDGSTKILNYSTFDELLDALTPKFVIFDIPTNDRMIYQKGLFVCFYDCLCLGDFIAYQLCKGLKIEKYKILVKSKRSLLDSIYKNYRHYDPEHLMDPYLFFKE